MKCSQARENNPFASPSSGPLSCCRQHQDDGCDESNATLVSRSDDSGTMRCMVISHPNLMQGATECHWRAARLGCARVHAVRATTGHGCFRLDAEALQWILALSIACPAQVRYVLVSTPIVAWRGEPRVGEIQFVYPDLAGMVTKI